MQKAGSILKDVTQRMDMLAGIGVLIIMLVIVSNVILRALFKQPLLGAYEIVSYFTAIVVALALAHCAIQNGHIVVDYLVKRFSEKNQAMLATLINLIALVFWSMASWQMFLFFASSKSHGMISASAQIPVYPFIFIIAIGLTMLSLVIVMQTLNAVKHLAQVFSFQINKWPIILPNLLRRESK